MSSVFFYLMIGFALADDVEKEEIATVEKGQIVPFDGTLFSTLAAAKLLVDLEASKNQCDLKILEAVEKKSAEKQYEIEILKIENKNAKERHEAIIGLKNENINILHNELKRSTADRSALWFGSGVVAGILITTASAWSLSQINKSAN